ncbi:class I SAM-dependent methyltransferase [Actinomadura decatromicini]|uniref:Class I SAM-dependent methyltransferase n=1 Tax=Actinomadura decatromicini TaxID=2604572 RepID=A0A5D3FNS3_9ACTN|nr:methyltransferase domain-containing protein [Actinomadura decatromicini]TYK49668.1 class I SAM-dependent methyltransferase [Actinomadura decatromicini]
MTAIRESGAIAPHLRRLLEFVEPGRDDVCLDVARGRGPMPAALGPQVGHLTAVDAMPAAARPGPAAVPSAERGAGSSRRMSTVEFGTGPVRIADGDSPPVATTREDRVPHPLGPDHVRVKADATALPYRDNTFSLVTARFSLYNLGDPDHVLRELLRVCRPGGRVIIADLVRGNLAGPDRDRIERLRDPDHPGTPSIARLTEMITSAGGSIRRLDVFTVERPIEPWLAGSCDDATAERIRTALVDEVDGGPKTGAKPRVIGGELWFTQTWAHVAAEPIP